ncbi:tetratricopeptide repeat protein [Paraglaciecola sp. 2405UD69-4]|uniref:tetratricopeptide repeat protein n=1 Tax=Paraglaciecola sp. 2405UD69-4 TaxID=3391836 RepID=UPI0039C982ED
MAINSLLKSCIGFVLWSAMVPMVLAQAKLVASSENRDLQNAYQQVLYEYYQGNFAQGLAKISLLEQQYPEGLSNISDSLRGELIEPELLKGAMSLAYGLNEQAAEIFTELLTNAQSKKVAAYAWLLLGEAYYREGEYESAAQAFSNISITQADNFFDSLTRDHWLYLQSQLDGFLLSPNTQTVTDSATDNWLDNLSDDSIYRQYIAYNKALGLLQSNKVEQAITELGDLASTDSGIIKRWGNWMSPLYQAQQDENDADERAAIRDRANLTLGFTLMQQGKPHDAYRTFEKIRTAGLDYNSALLGFGWAAAEKGDLQVALAIWQRLTQMPQHSEYTLEAYIASAYAYEKAFAPRQAMNMLQLGVTRFKEANQVLELALAQVSEPNFILDLIPGTFKTENQADSYALLSQKGQALDAQFIFESIAVTNEFKIGIEALKSSLEIQAQLLSWQQRMSHYHLMLDERKVDRSLRAEAMVTDRTLDKLESLKGHRDLLAAELEQAERLQDGSVFMSKQYQDWLKRVKRSEERLTSIAKIKSQLQQTPLTESYQKRLDIVAGRLIWLASEDLPANLWQAKKALADLDDSLLEAERRQQGLLTQLATEPLYAKHWQRVDAIAKRLSIQLKNNQLLQQTLVSQLSTLFKKAIIEHSDKVDNYLLQAQLAAVRLSDQALQKDEGELIEGGDAAKDNSL